MLGCMQHSLNVCLTWVAMQIGNQDFYTYLQKFGIGKKTNIDLAGEVTWPLSVPGDENWWEANLGTNSFGQGVSVTPIQFITAISAIANDGNMMAPHVLKSVIDNDRQYDYTPQIIGNPISKETARTLTDMLAVSLEEEASNALVPNYRVAGKTGTAEIAGPYGYTSNQTNASFVGWGPVADPKFVVFVWLEKPSSSPWGSIVASPVFSEIVQNLVTYMDIPPDGTQVGISNR
jgi:cell division protein FtsI/penicillin-binding protein 2